MEAIQIISKNIYEILFVASFSTFVSSDRRTRSYPIFFKYSCFSSKISSDQKKYSIIPRQYFIRSRKHGLEVCFKMPIVFTEFLFS